jgi:hypothetical protein
MRKPIKRWPPIRKEVLLEEVYKADHPPFGPFPTVTNIVNAALCPFAAVHDILYGIDDARLRPESWGAGSLFHEYIAHLKASLIEGSCIPGGEKRLYDNFVEGRYEAAREECWMYIRYWLDRKREELRRLDRNTRTYFEVYVANDSVEVDEGYHYPLRGKIDELDTTNRRIIERTILGTDSARSPPALKDFQIWLLWKLLCSLKKEDKPDIWKNENFEDYELVIETPYRDFTVLKNNKVFNTMSLDAFSWIHDISSERFKYAIWEAWENRRCSYDLRNPDCTLDNRYCYRRRPTYPCGREVMRTDLRRFYISLLCEQMWSHHLFMYQLMKAPLVWLSGRKILRGSVEVAGDEVIVSLEKDEDLRSLKEKIREGEILREINVIFGTLKLGLFRRAEIKDFENHKLVLKIWGREPLPKSINILLPEVSLFREEPWFLRRKIQREMYSLGLWGLEKEERARRHSIVQLIDAIFWNKDLVMKKPAKMGVSKHES